MFGVFAAFSLLVLSVLMGAGCGPDDPCADKTCSFGACEASTGNCINESTCYVDQDCIPGYLCSENRECVAQNTCSEDGECPTGVCRDGACVNPQQCESNGECLPRTFCNQQGECVPDPCNDVTCQRGVCERGTDNCISRDTCTPETEAIDCIRGEKCAAGSCEPAESFCDEISCDRGVCSFEAGGCQDAMDCQGDDARCLEGDYCNDMNTCRPDLCERNDVECQRGVCVPTVGQCQNPTSCDDTSDCLSNHVCIDGTCRLESVACGDAGGEGGCPGNQNCNFNDGTCSEPEVCETSFDCKSGRQCAGLSCLASTTCKADRYEPSDSPDNTIDLLSVSEGSGALSGTLCQGDIDRFSFETTDFLSGSQSGTLIVEMDVPRRDAGLGAFEIVVLKDGTEVTSARSGALGRKDTLRAETNIGLADHGSYVAEVRAKDDMTSAGIHYDIAVNVSAEEVQSACNQAIDLRANQSISGTTADAPSSNLGSTCTAADNSSSERIYRIELDAPQQMTFTLSPQLSGADLSMSLRENCAQPSSERYCVEESGEGSDETLQALLNRGTYFLIVQPTVDGSGGPFQLTTETTFKACTDLDNFCSDAQTAELCSPTGGRFRSVECDADCNPSTGGCFPPAGDTCGDAPQLNPEMMGSDAPITREINLPQFKDEYRIESGGCLDSNARRTAGPDKTYAVTLPPGKGVTAEVIFENEVEGSLYVAETCGDISGTCLKGAANSTDQDNKETLTFSNRTDSEITRTLVVDTAADQLIGSTSLSLTFKDVICTPGMKQCAGLDVETCNDSGTAYRVTNTCGYSCSQAVCQGEVCSSAIHIPNDGTEYTYTLAMGDFAGDYDINEASCIGSFNDAPGHEAVFTFQANANDVVDISWDPPEDPSLYVVSDCSDLGGSCIAGIEDFGSSSVSQKFVVNQAGTYYVMADIDGTGSGQYGSSTLTAQIQQPTCTPKTASCTSGEDLDYCNSFGLSSTYSCSNCCASLGSGSSSPSAAIPDNDPAGLSDTLTVSGCSGTTSKLYVSLDITHTFIGDLVIDLTGPTGTTVNLWDQSGGSDDDILGLFPETLTPNESLTPFNGLDPSGTWTLDIEDTTGADTGTLQSWSVYAACN
jgi:subtilisin-like proprotein convertase family protein